jgi:mono/diheme cytochrome c family protein
VRKLILGFALGILAIPAVALLAAWLGYLPTTAKAEPPPWEKTFARMALRSSVIRHAPHITNPVQPSDENLLAGMKIFRDACAGCHGDPNGNSDYGASFYPPVPQFAVTPPRLPDFQLFWIVKNGIRYSGMSGWDRQWQNDETVSDDKIWKVVTFVSRIKSLPPTVDAEWHKKQ